MDRLADSLISPAPAEVAGQGVINIGIAGVMIRRKQGGRLHHLTRLAVAALRDLLGAPRLLHGVAVVARQPLDRHDSPAGYSGDRR